ncbi:T9SS type A sorting domain-containing protein [Telluribacter sp.]|jgi:hypothetical protein|uniref:T9SS type A sorting domain-containing protein n=1 Tax=Telluribacter sp. TaxID=1978767 RepID=UPI002E0F69F2|nr:T9SS type A sorting domain-containing protein [Telluribacter sp.]
MKKVYYFAAFLSLITACCLAQKQSPEVISVQGGVGKSATIMLEWTLGELATQSLSTNTHLYTQGFHQPVLQVQELPEPGTDLVENAIRVYPNPTASLVTVNLPKDFKTPVSLFLLNSQGQLLKEEVIVDNELFQLDLEPYSEGTYLLRFSTSEGPAPTTFKIIKTH